MHQIQAVIISCDDERVTNSLDNFIENSLSLYAVVKKYYPGGIKFIFDAQPERDILFDEIEELVTNHNLIKVIVINHTDCAEYGGSQAFDSQIDELRNHEVQLRHAVSSVHARFLKQDVEAYLAVLTDDGIKFNKVI